MGSTQSCLQSETSDVIKEIKTHSKNVEVDLDKLLKLFRKLERRNRAFHASLCSKCKKKVSTLVAVEYTGRHVGCQTDREIKKRSLKNQQLLDSSYVKPSADEGLAAFSTSVDVHRDEVPIDPTEKNDYSNELRHYQEQIHKLETEISRLNKQVTVVESGRDSTLNSDRQDKQELKETQRTTHKTDTELSSTESTLVRGGDSSSQKDTGSLQIIESLKISLQSKEAEYEILQKKFEEFITDNKVKLKSVQDEASICASRLAVKTEENEKLSSKVSALEMCQEQLQKELQAAVLEKDIMCTTLDTIKKELGDLQSRQTEYDTAKRELQRENAEFITLNSDLTKRNTEMSSTIDGLLAELDQLRDDFSSKEKELYLVRMDNEKFAADSENLQTEMKALQVLKLKEDADMLSKIGLLQKDIETLTEKNAEKEAELQRLHLKVEEIENEKNKIVIGLRTECSGMGKAMVETVRKMLECNLHSKLSSEKICFTIQPWKKGTTVPAGPLVVPCLNMSRVGTNILDALGGLTPNKDVIVLVLHNTSKENLTSMTPTSLRVTGAELRQLGGIIDMAFGDSGLYDCEMNNTAIEKMAKILKTYR